MEWQQIETAPRDGTAIWVSNGFSMRVAFWANGKEFEHLGSIGGGWRDFFEASHPNRMADLMFAPVYWQALPKPPHRNRWRNSRNASDISEEGDDDTSSL